MHSVPRVPALKKTTKYIGNGFEYIFNGSHIKYNNAPAREHPRTTVAMAGIGQAGGMTRGGIGLYRLVTYTCYQLRTVNAGATLRRQRRMVGRTANGSGAAMATCRFARPIPLPNCYLNMATVKQLHTSI